jgi:hypothetical protein
VIPSVVQLPADVHQIDATGYVWTFLDEAAEPGQISVGALIQAGADDAPFQARVVDISTGTSGRQIVHLDPLA